ncbi:ankyrin repeat domain-containing protein [Aspergillus ibericus CBS 121593]|uniref:Ankyrin n=1 Tax=Aspergillus ibericus CBS 121593 TaxID=1448316 RepID=A0A395GZI0_9EURO|nr:ankyrin [Aspergillus ibericus CBS 121593]RAL00743.1 ankyrin [Aspergillus ibericus CBS 121593]
MGDQDTFNNTEHSTTHNQAGHQVVNGGIYNINNYYSRDRSQLDEKLLEAAKRGDTARVQQLLDDGANASATDAHGQTVLHVAASEGRRDLVSLLLNRGAKRDARDHSNRQPAQRALLSGHISLANLLG